MKRLGLLLILLSSFLLATRGQEDNSVSWQDYLSILMENEDITEDDYENIASQIEDLVQNPINLNTATEEQLSNILFLNEYQVKEISTYVQRYAPIRSWSELLMIRMLDPVRRGLLQCVTYLGPVPEQPTLKSELDSIKFSKGAVEYSKWSNEDKGRIDASVGTPFTQDGSYQGAPLRYWARAKYNINRSWQFGLLASQDVGEPLRKTGLDYYTGYLQWKTNSQRLKSNVILGRYRIKTGIGLILNRNISFLSPISSLISNSSSLTPRITPNLSRSEGTYLQGAAVTLNSQLSALNFNLTAFASYRSIDATITSNEADLGDLTAISTILTTGYHRTESELNRRHNANMASGGVSGTLELETQKLGTIHFGATAVVNHYSLPLHPCSSTSESQLYRKYMPTGQTFWNASIEYGYSLNKKLCFQGETAIGDCHYVATVNRLTFQVSRHLQLSALQRYYPYQFYATLGSSYAAGSKNITGSNCQNESGVYLGGSWTPSSRFSLTAYSDYAYHAWYRYRKGVGSHQWDNMLMLSWMPSPHSLLNFKARLKETNQRINLSYNINWWNKWTLKPQVQLCFSQESDPAHGISPGIISGFTAKHLSISTGCEYFYTTNYYARLYIYESTTPYNFSSVQLSGEGIHFYALLKLNGKSLTPNLSPLILNLKYSGTGYLKYTTRAYSQNLQIVVSWQF